MISNARKTLRMRMLLLASAVILILVFSASVQAAGFIRLSSRIIMENIIQNNETELNISLTNLGNEAALNVHSTLLMTEGFKSTDFYSGEIQPNSTSTGTLKLEIGDVVNPGTYSFALLIRYTDINGYPLSTPYPLSIVYKNPTSPLVHGVISSADISGEGSGALKLKVSNRDMKAHDVLVRLYLPDELKVDSIEKQISIDGGKDAELEFQVSSFGALTGSSYVIFASIEYEDGLHYSSAARGMVNIVEDRFEIPRWLPIAVIVVLVLIFLVAQFRK